MQMNVKITDGPKSEKGLKFLDSTFNLCKLEKGSVFSPVFKPTFDILRKSSNMTWSCPFGKVEY